MVTKPPSHRSKQQITPTILRSFIFFLLLLFLERYHHRSYGTPEDPELTFEHLYQYGRREYTAENWSDCIAFLLRALDDFNYFQDESAWCRRMCLQAMQNSFGAILKSGTGFGGYGTTEPFEERFIASRKFMYVGMQHSLCLLKCYNEKFTEQRPPISNPETYYQFVDRRPYHYLQYCYWKVGDLGKAARSAYTFLIGNPQDKDTVENLHFYMEQEGFKSEMLTDYLQPKFERFYVSGVVAYNEKEWPTCIENFRRSLDSFLEKLDDCRIACDQRIDVEPFKETIVDLSVVTSSLYASVLRCRNECITELSKINGRRMKKFLKSHFDYMHLCQYRAGYGQDACQSVSDALLLDSKNVIMRRNKKFYLDVYKRPELFIPNKKIVDLYTKLEIERRLLEFVDVKFRYSEGRSLPPRHPTDRAPMDFSISLEDSFDYSRLDGVLVTANECKMLGNYFMLYPNIKSREIRIFAEELAKRISEKFEADTPAFSKLSCGEQKSGCELGTLSVGVEHFQCGQLSGENFGGCSLVFCVD